MRAVTATWKPADQARARGQLSCSKKISAFCAILFDRLSDDAHVGDAGLFYRVHDRGECAEGNIFIGADENELVVRVANFLAEPGGDLIDGASFGYADFDTRLQNGSGHHKNDEENEDDVDQRSDVDISEGGLGAAVGGSESHQRLTSAAACGWMLSMALRTSREKSSPRAAKTRMELPIKL